MNKASGGGSRVSKLPKAFSQFVAVFSSIFALTLHSGPFRDGNLDRMNRISRVIKEDM